MQISTSPAAAAAAAPPPSVQPSHSAARLLPPELLSTRVGTGTVRSEIDRSIRVLLEGKGRASERSIVPDSKAAAELIASEHGATFTEAVRSFLSVADAHEGKERLKSITFLPDEHASKGVTMLGWANHLAGRGASFDEVVEPDAAALAAAGEERPDVPQAELRAELRTATARAIVKQLTGDEASNVNFHAAWNWDGHIVLMPDVSRDLFSSLGLYRHQPGDEMTRVPRARRDLAARSSWHTAIHETHHSVTPLPLRENPEWTRVVEEAIPEILTPAALAPVMRRAGADLALARRPARDTRGEAVGWPAWNRDHLPAPPTELAEKAQGRYTDGPALFRDLVRLAGVDRRTTAGKAEALELLQGQDASRVPLRLADAIVAARGMDAAQAPKLADLIRAASIGEAGIRDIADLVGDPT